MVPALWKRWFSAAAAAGCAIISQPALALNTLQTNQDAQGASPLAKQANILSFDEAKRAARANRPSFVALENDEPLPSSSSRRGAASRSGNGTGNVRAVRGSSRDARGSRRASANDFRSSTAHSRSASMLDGFSGNDLGASRRAAGSRASRSCSAFSSEPAAQPAAPRRAIFDEQALAEEEGEDSPRKKTVRDKLDDARRSRSKAKAERAFSRQFGSEGGAGASGSAAGPRAAVYKGEMGQSHRRAARMQDEASPDAPSRKGHAHSVSGLFASLKQSRLFIASMGALVCLVFSCAFLYDPAQQYYQSIRENARLQAEYDAVAARNEALQAEVDELGSDAGVEARAREDFGWVKEDEQAVVVYGLETTDDDEAALRANVIPGSVEAPETWYSPVLDFVFRVK